MPDREWDDLDWKRVVEQVRTGDCTPFLGPDASPGVVSLRKDLVRGWSAEYGYPFDEGATVHDMAQYVSILEGDRVLVKQRYAQRLTELAEPDYTVPAEPHSLLAGWPINVHLTTNHDDYMTRALERAGKQPQTAICPWYEGAASDEVTTLPADYQPQVEEPLVYHLHGSMRHPVSLVLAEQDHVELLTRLSNDVGADARTVVPPHVFGPLASQPLLFIGYSLRDWSFRMLLHGFVEAVAKPRQRRHVSAQLMPDADTDDPDKQQRALDYLKQYFERLNISVYWGSASEFCNELHRRLETT